MMGQPWDPWDDGHPPVISNPRDSVSIDPPRPVPLNVTVDALLPKGMWMLISDGIPDGPVAVIGSHRYQPEAFYAGFGYTRAPTEGPFAFRQRAEFCAGLRILDINRTRDRLYHMWRDRQ